MGEEEEQRSKREAASSYDYENDPRWPDYWSNVLIPPTTKSRSHVITHFKHKFYQRFIDPDFVVEPMPSSPPPPPPSNAQDRARTSSGSGNRSSGTNAAQGSNPTPLRWDHQTVLFAVNALVFVVAVFAVIPLVPTNLSNRAYQLSFFGATFSSLCSLYSLYGKPGAWTSQALETYFRSIVAAKDYVIFLYCLSFVTSHLSLKFALIPIIYRSLEHVAKYLRRNFSHSTLYRKYLEVLCMWVESNNTTLNILTSLTEIELGFLLIISLLSWQRNIIHTFLYWQLLKFMYQAPGTAANHQSIWAGIGRRVNPFIQRYVPFLNTPISAIQRWWFR